MASLVLGGRGVKGRKQTFSYELLLKLRTTKMGTSFTDFGRSVDSWISGIEKRFEAIQDALRSEESSVRTKISTATQNKEAWSYKIETDGDKTIESACDPKTLTEYTLTTTKDGKYVSSSRVKSHSESKGGISKSSSSTVTATSQHS